MKPLRSIGLVFAFFLIAPAARAETDLRDGEALAHIPNNGLVTLGYFRHISASDSQSFTQNVANFRAAYILKFGNVAVVPFDGYLPVADVEVYEPTPAGITTTLHTSGVGDFTYLPTIAYIQPEGDNHTFVLFNPNFTMPTGNYDQKSLINVGNRQWVFKPQVAIGQRFLRAATAELVGNASFYTTNHDFVVPLPTGGVTTTPMSQKPTFGGEVHVGVDLSTTFSVGGSYYYTANGVKKLNTLGVEADQPTFQTLRFTWGIRLETNSLLYLQYDQDVFASHDGAISRWFGVRFSHVFASVPVSPAPAASSGTASSSSNPGVAHP